VKYPLRPLHIRKSRTFIPVTFGVIGPSSLSAVHWYDAGDHDKYYPHDFRQLDVTGAFFIPMAYSVSGTYAGGRGKVHAVDETSTILFTIFDFSAGYYAPNYGTGDGFFETASGVREDNFVHGWQYENTDSGQTVTFTGQSYIEVRFLTDIDGRLFYTPP
jgi:hypothetical protein